MDDLVASFQEFYSTYRFIYSRGQPG
ncbi:hypothetical protein CNECB9_760019 [Cupriavidus necator]|uniref:Uncharacterized protein n=1 Tax=Cupriavidus necator TaxID=106590 RepID=A0A1K0IRS5_CUPNE|nr:hypothetical protein CNECB9_760019 [Cupriavidus necator]